MQVRSVYLKVLLLNTDCAFEQPVQDGLGVVLERQPRDDVVPKLLHDETVEQRPPAGGILVVERHRRQLPFAQVRHGGFFFCPGERLGKVCRLYRG